MICCRLPASSLRIYRTRRAIGWVKYAVMYSTTPMQQSR